MSLLVPNQTFTLGWHYRTISAQRPKQNGVRNQMILSSFIWKLLVALKASWWCRINHFRAIWDFYLCSTKALAKGPLLLHLPSVLELSVLREGLMLSATPSGRHATRENCGKISSTSMRQKLKNEPIDLCVLHDWYQIDFPLDMIVI